MNFVDIFEYCKRSAEELSKKAPYGSSGYFIGQTTSPMVAQVYRIPNIWQGDLDSVKERP